MAKRESRASQPKGSATRHWWVAVLVLVVALGGRLGWPGSAPRGAPSSPALTSPSAAQAVTRRETRPTLLEGGGIAPVVQRATALYTPLSLGEPDWQVAPLAPGPVVGLLQAVIVVGFFVRSLVAGYRLSAGAYGDARAASRALVPMAVLSCVFTVAAIVLLNQPMGMRHGM